MEEITACTLDCPDSCSLVVSGDFEKGFGIRGNPDHPFTKGFTCRKARNFIKRLQSPHRVTTPLVRSRDGWQVIGWPEALDLCAEKIRQCREEPASILHIQGEGAKGVLKGATRLFFAMLGASRVRGSLCDAAGYVASLLDFGSRDNNDVTDLLHSRRIVNWGRDLSRSSVHTAAIVRTARKGGTKVLTISPGGDGNDAFSDARVRIRPGTDRFLAAAVIRRFVETGAIPEDVLSHTANWDEFREVILHRTVNDLAAACGVSGEEVERLFEFYRTGEPVASIIGTGLQRYVMGGENVRFINALALISGNIGRSGGGSYYHLHSLRNLDVNWTADPEGKPLRSLYMPVIGREILGAVNPSIRMIWVNGSNVINQGPDSREIARAFDAVGFKVVVDAFMTDTAERADLILPCALMLEQEDIVASYLHDYVHYVKAVLKPPGEAKTDYWIVSRLGRRLAPPVLLPEPDDCFRAALKTPWLAVSLDELRKKKFVRACRNKLAYAGMRFDHPDGKSRFPSALHEDPPAPEGYASRLLTLIRGDAIHSQIPPEEQSAPPCVWVAPDSPQLKRLNPEKETYLVSPVGRLKVTVRQLADLHPEAVLYRRGDWMKLGGGANQLIAAGFTDIGRGAPFYSQWVRLENG